MASKRKFYKTTITVEVISEEKPREDLTLADYAREGVHGEFSLTWKVARQSQLGGRATAKALESHNTDPNFFGLTPEGDDED